MAQVVEQDTVEPETYEDIIARYLSTFNMPALNVNMGGQYNAPVGANTLMGQVLSGNPNIQYGTPEFSQAYNDLAAQYAQRVGLTPDRIQSGTSGGIYAILGQNRQAQKPIERMAATADANFARQAANPEAYAGAPPGGFKPGRVDFVSPAQMRAAGVNDAEEYRKKLGG